MNLRERPYPLFFATGLLLTLAGVGHWLAHAAGLLPEYRPVFHSVAQVQGFLTCFACGFLFTMIPRRTESPPAAGWQLAAALAGPVLATGAAWAHLWVASQIAWLAGTTVVTAFVVARLSGRRAARRPPVGFVWIPMAWAMGVGGSVATLAPATGLGPAWLHQLGRGLVLQGMFTGLVLGAGSLALPLMTRGEGPPDATGASRDRLATAAHVAAGTLLAGSFWIERVVSFRAGPLLRGAVALAVLLVAIRLGRPVRRPGWNARLIRLSAWLVPAGFLLAGAFPTLYLAALHVTFVGGFGLLALAVGMQVTLGHSGRRDEQLGRPWQVAAIGGLVLAATGARALMDLDFRRRMVWMAVAAGLFVAATLVWALFLGGKRRDVIP